MEFFNDASWEEEFAFTVFKKSIDCNELSNDELKKLLILEKKNYMIGINELVWHLKIHGINACLIHAERGGANDVTWDFQYLNHKIENAYKEHIKTRVNYYMAKKISDTKKK